MTNELGVKFPKDIPTWQVNGAVTVALFIFLFAISMLIVALFAGGPSDPLDVRTSTVKGSRKRRRK
jgi:quinol-cytochrome oxidoreductase complex cytochrome b subunit